MAADIEFDWDAENIRHLKRHRVGPSEFEELMTGSPLYLEYQTVGADERYKVPGATKMARILIGVWTPRAGRIRAVTAYPANRILQRVYMENQQ